MDLCAAKEAIIIYADYLRKKVTGIPERIEFNRIKLAQDLKPIANLMYMKYVLSNSYCVHNNSVEKVAFDHLIKMIDEIKEPEIVKIDEVQIDITENYLDSGKYDVSYFGKINGLNNVDIIKQTSKNG